jgi:sucrose-6F-phosphate phosphohydrolase
MRSAGTNKLLVCSDLDRTLVPNGEQEESPGARALFRAFAARPEVLLCYVSGRHLSLVEQAIHEYQLPRPDYVVGDVGTTLYQAGRGNRWSQVDDWHAALAADWRGRTPDELRQVLASLNVLRLQEAEKQNELKLSFYLPLDADLASLQAGIEERLAGAGVDATQVYSIDEAASIGLLDILPARAGKLAAIRYLSDRLGFGSGNTVFCGDSGNDLDVLASALPGVLVANATEEVRMAALELSAANRNDDCLYLARGGFLGLNGNYSAGVLEGIAHYHPDIVDWLDDESAVASR